jgi:fucose 4-O-acetylase-like acetyltransferase
MQLYYTCKISKNAIGMGKKIEICTVVKPVYWISCFFANITIIFIVRIIFNVITQFERLFKVSVPHAMRQCSTSDIQDEFTISTLE